jgi:hypothetical protein
MREKNCARTSEDEERLDENSQCCMRAGARRERERERG